MNQAPNHSTTGSAPPADTLANDMDNTPETAPDTAPAAPSSSPTNPAPVQMPATSRRMVSVLGGIAMLSGLLVVLTWQLTLPRIEYNREQAIARAVFKILPGSVRQQTLLVSEESLRPLAEGGSGIRIYAAHDENDRLTGIAAEASAQGYQDLVRILYGYDPRCECITGFVVLQSTETPGLGDKIVTDPQFLANFPLATPLAMDGTELANPIVTVKHGSKNSPWQIDAISGATITSVAVGKGLQNSAARLLPLLHRHRQQLQEIR